MTITVLKSDAHADCQTIQLSFGVNLYGGSDTILTVAHLGKSYVNLARLNENLERDEWGKVVEPEKIALSAQEMDTLVEAWTAFKAGIAAKEQARLERIAAQQTDALALIASVKTDVPELDITLTQNSSYPDRFVVEVPAFNFHESVYESDEFEEANPLLDAVKRAIKRIEENVVYLESQQGKSIYTRSTSETERERDAAMVAAWRKVRPLISAEAEQAEQEDALNDSLIF